MKQFFFSWGAEAPKIGGGEIVYIFDLYNVQQRWWGVREKGMEIFSIPCRLYRERSLQILDRDPSVTERGTAGLGFFVAHACPLPTNWKGCMALHFGYMHLVLENVISKKYLEMVHFYLGSAYWIDQADTDSVCFGWPTRRARQYIHCRHKLRCGANISPLSKFLRRFYRIVGFKR